ncbi:MAG: acylphosphatase [Salinisphaera sp.]|jgi:acylphosphatase|nr:acylphosphatase [Salinisphaera sp.]
MPEAKQYRIGGRVQGVGFRAATCDKARELGMAGWVRNRRDGTVEVMATGSESALRTLRDWLGHGPRHARVDTVSVECVNSGDLTTPFSIR